MSNAAKEIPREELERALFAAQSLAFKYEPLCRAVSGMRRALDRKTRYYCIWRLGPESNRTWAASRWRWTGLLISKYRAQVEQLLGEREGGK